METPYSRITEIKEAGTPEEANGLLREGFTLIKVLEKYTNDTERQFSNIVYVLGRHNSNGGGHPAAQNGRQNGASTVPATAVDPSVLESRPWKKYANGSGEWTFYMDRDENLLPELVSLRDSIEQMKSGEALTVGNYTYKIKDKFLKRFPADEQG